MNIVNSSCSQHSKVRTLRVIFSARPNSYTSEAYRILGHPGSFEVAEDTVDFRVPKSSALSGDGMKYTRANS